MFGVRALVVAAGFCLTAALASPTPIVRIAPQSRSAAESAIREAIASAGAEVAVVWQPLDAQPSERLAINARERFHAASTMKVPIMIELFRRAAAGDLRLDDTMLVTNRFTSIVDGSPYELSVTEDSDGEVYKAIGQQRPLRVLCEAMITVSSNLAANLMIERLGAKQIQATVDGLGAGGMQVLRGVEDQKAFDRGLNNTTDAEGLATLFLKLGRGEVVSPAASREMIDILARQKFNEGIPAGVAAGVRVAHKTGSITRIRHDAGIVFAPRPYVLVVLVRGLDDAKVADALIARISQAAAGLGAR